MPPPAHARVAEPFGVSVSALDTLHGSDLALDADTARKVPVVVYAAETGADGAWLYVSPQIEELLGYTPAEMLGDPGLWAARLHPEDRAWVLAEEADDAERASGRSAAEYRMLAKDGRVVWLLDDTRLMHDPELGKVQHGLLFDITIRKQAELRLAEHAGLLERIARGESLDHVLQALAESLVRLTGAETVRVGLDEPRRSYLAGQRLGSASATAHVLRFGPERGAFGEITLVGLAVVGDDVAAWGQRLATLAVARARQDESEARAYSLQLATVESTVDGILVVADDGAVLSTNQRFRDMVGVDDDIAEEGTDVDVARRLLDQLADRQPFLSRLYELREQPELSSVDELCFRDGRTVEAFSQPQLHDGAPVGRVWSFRDVTSVRRLEDDLRKQAYTDALTSLPNRHRFMQHLGAFDHGGGPDAESRPVPAGHALVLIDLDDFKTINDGLGHFVGDTLLVTVAERISSGTAGAGIGMAARMGGDEFALHVRCPEGRDQVETLVEALMAGLGLPVTAGSRQLTIRASVGVALSDGSASARDLVRNADLAMYTAKRAGGNRSCVYTPDMYDAALARLELKEDLGRAIERGELQVAYQPVVSLDSGQVDGFEALARWYHPTLGPIPPGEFVPLAEESGLIGRLGQWVLNRVCCDIAAWQRQAGAEEVPTVSVNLSPRQLAEPGLAEQVAATIAEHGLRPQSICLEVTETALGQGAATVSDTLADLHARGLQLSLDDFGTGHSSLARLGSYPFDVVKIDRSFVLPVTHDARHRAVVRAILQLAEAFELDVIAEGVETDEQREALAELGCGRVQGFLFSKPVPAEQAERLLGEGPGCGALSRRR